MRMRVLLVEDDAVISDVVCAGLKEARFLVDRTADGAEGLRLAAGREYSVVILDLMLPGQDGLTICREIRHRRNSVPILMLTARDAVSDRVKGFEAGADDYLPKPFDFEELLARVRSLIRRDKVHRGRMIRVADLEIDSVARVVTRSGRAIPLTAREYTLLEALALNEGQVVTREMILERIWGDEESYSNTVAVHVASLRKKIDTDRTVKLIHTAYGRGYVLRAAEVAPC